VSPLKSGALSGKYTRKNAGEVKGDRGFMDSFVNEKTFTVVDALEGIAQAHDSTVARVALSAIAYCARSIPHFGCCSPTR
jgi:aryl-alcohol dehydrogenase-like predicted oxidoreductase